jgi:maltose alpha-D-glucosyltransferase/alpha-amylase
MRDEFRKIMGLWLQLGVDGFRMDAAPFLINLLGTERGEDMRQSHDFLRELQDFAAVRSGNAILLGEVEEGLSTLADYFGGGNELQALFNFPLNRYLFLGLAQESADPIKFGLNELPAIPERGQWVNFLRHHDELNLSRLTKDQREQVFAAFGPEPEMQIYGRGLRRQLAPMLFYGEEIGMGEQMALPGRLSVRAPMQWTDYDNGGFSPAPPERFVRPILSGGDYGFERVSVGALRGNRESLLNWLAELIRTRRECGGIGAGAWRALDTGHDAVLGLRYDVDDHLDSAIVVLNNLSRQRCTVTLDLSEHEIETTTDLFADHHHDPIDPKTGRVRLDGFGYRWLRLVRLGGVY